MKPRALAGLGLVLSSAIGAAAAAASGTAGGGAVAVPPGWTPVPSGAPPAPVTSGAASLAPSASATPPASSAPAPPTPSAAPATQSAAPQAPSVASDTCRERVPAGKDRPKLTEKVPSRAESGHALTLSFVLEHGKGETVLPGGFQPQSDSTEWRALEHLGLYVPDPDGGAGPVVERTEHGDRATTTIELSLVALPQKPGRNRITIPALPLSVARASGDVLVLCTSPHEVTIEDPIANVSNPMPKPNPPARPQREEWTLLKQAVLGAAIALPVGLLAAWLLGRWLRRPRPAPPAPPPRPPWEVALEELFDVRHAGLVAEGRLAEHFDRVSDIVRKYLGARFGFDGLESTTREALSLLRRATPRIDPLDAIEAFLRQADLVKFAKTVPSAEDGELALVRAEHIVRQTLPLLPGEARAPEAGPTGTPGPDQNAAAEQAPSATDGPADEQAQQEAAEWGPKPPEGGTS